MPVFPFQLDTATYPCLSQMWHVSTATRLCNEITTGVKKSSISPKTNWSRWLQTTCALAGQNIRQIIKLKRWFDWAGHAEHMSWSEKARLLSLSGRVTDKLPWMLRTRKKAINYLQQFVPAASTLNTSDISVTDETCNICIAFHTASFTHPAVHCHAS